MRFTGQGPQFKAWFEDRSVVFQQAAATVRMSFERGAGKPEIQAAQPLGAMANYLTGQESDKWTANIPMFGSIYYRQVWKGIDVRFLGRGDEAKTEYLVAPGASLDQIRLRFDGRAEIGSDGSLAIENESGRYVEGQPVLYVEDGAERKEISGGFRRNADGTIGFRAERYDTSKRLVVDPVILFSGYFGGSSQSAITAVAVNSYYNIVVAGWTASTNLPASGGAKTSYAGGVDAFVAGFSPAGGTLLFCTYLGGSGDDRAFGVAVDSANNTYITGQTSSSNFPVVNGYQTHLSGTRDAFVAKLNAAGNALVFSTYLGGKGVDLGNGIVVDSGGEPVIVGDTTSSNLPVTSQAFQPGLAGVQNAFVAKLAATGKSLVFMTYLGGNATDHGAAIALDPSNALWIGGATYSTTLPSVTPFQPASGGGQDGFLAKLSSDGTALAFCSYIGGSGGSPSAPEEVNAVALTNLGVVAVGGTTSSPDFPIQIPIFQQTYGGGNTDGFIARIGTNYALLSSGYVGGSGDDGITAIAVDAEKEVYIGGYTSSTDFPTANPIQSSNHGGLDGFVLKTGWSSIIYSTYLGGSGSDSVTALAVDSLTSLVAVGTTGSSSFPVSGHIGTWPGSQISSFITKLVPNFKAVAVNQPSDVFDTWHNTGYNGPNLTLTTASFGIAGDLPVSGDWTGTGVKRIGVFRNGTWYLDINGDGVYGAGDKTVVFGQAGDVPVVGDWNGTGTVKLGLFRQGTFILDLSGHLSGVPTGLSDATFPFGLSTDIPVAADWSQSGATKVGVFRSGVWYVDYNGTHSFSGAAVYTFGQAGDLPVVGDWDGSGIPNKIGVYRQGIWILDYIAHRAISTPFDLVFTFGGAGYIPLVM